MANNVKEAIDVATDTMVRRAIWRADFSKLWPLLICGAAAVPIGIYSFTLYFFHMLMRAWGGGQ